MITEINTDFYNKFPRVYTIAEVFGFTQNDIEKLIDILKNDSYCKTFYSRDSTIETVLRVIILRLDLKRDDFFKYILSRKSVLYWIQSDFEKASKLVGNYALSAYVAILANKDKIDKY